MKKIILVILISISSYSCTRTVAKHEDDNSSLFERDDNTSVSDLDKNIEVQSNISYGEHKQQKLDLYLPKQKSTELMPIIFLVHGGAWMFGDKASPGLINNKINYWIPKGFVIASVNYRMSFSPNPQDQLLDIAKALDFLAGKAPSINANPKKIILMGHSAGAHLVSLLSVKKDLIKSEILGTIALDSAAFNLVNIMTVKHFKFYDRVFGNKLENWILNSPQFQMKDKIKPFLGICSSKRDNSCSEADKFKAKAIELNSPLVKIYPVDLTHMEINKLLGVESEYTKEVNDFINLLIARSAH